MYNYKRFSSFFFCCSPIKWGLKSIELNNLVLQIHNSFFIFFFSLLLKEEKTKYMKCRWEKELYSLIIQNNCFPITFVSYVYFMEIIRKPILFKKQLSKEYGFFFYYYYSWILYWMIWCVFLFFFYEIKLNE